MNKYLYIKLFVFLCCIHSLYASTIDTLQVWSESMQKNIPVMVISPDKTSRDIKNFPTIYLLHGHNGNERTWLNIKPELTKIADEKRIIFVCPNGENSWYWDSPIDATYRYETFISNELVSYIDNHYPTITHRNSRAITGLSMGGHGALWNAWRHSDTFGACGSMSGGVDIHPFPEKWNIAKRLGEYENNKQIWNSHTVINLVEQISANQHIIIDCGEDDFFLQVNRMLHQKLYQNGITHDFIIRPGGHDAPYWNNAVDYQILFFEKFFKL